MHKISASAAGEVNHLGASLWVPQAMPQLLMESKQTPAAGGVGAVGTLQSVVSAKQGDVSLSVTTVGKGIGVQSLRQGQCVHQNTSGGAVRVEFLSDNT